MSEEIEGLNFALFCSEVLEMLKQHFGYTPEEANPRSDSEPPVNHLVLSFFAIKLDKIEATGKMKTIETIATVTDDNRLIAKVTPDISPGEHKVVLVIDEQPTEARMRPVADFPVIGVGAWLAISH